MGMAISLQNYLSNQHASYDVMEHPRALCSSWTARASHISERDLAKAVVLRAEDGRYMLAVLPAAHRVDLDELSRLLGGSARMVSEDEFEKLFPDCDPGAVPPLGAAYGLGVVMDDALTERTELYLEGGDHCTLVRLGREQFLRLMGDAPHGRFSHPRDGALSEGTAN